MLGQNRTSITPRPFLRIARQAPVATVLAVAARSPADERSLMRDSEGVATIELKVADAPVGTLRMRAREGAVDASLMRLVTTLIASEMERTRAPERASEEAAGEFQRAALSGQIADTKLGRECLRGLQADK